MLETAYGVACMAKERRERYRSVNVRQLTIGIVLCVIGVIPILLIQLFAENKTVAQVLSVGAMLVLIALGVFLIVCTCIIWGGFQALLEEGDYTRGEKLENKKNATLSTIYWLAVTAGYLAWSFITMQWYRTWIVWPVAGVAFGIVTAIAKALRSRG